MGEEPKPQINKNGLLKFGGVAAITVMLTYGAMKISNSEPQITPVQSQTQKHYVVLDIDNKTENEYKILKQNEDFYLSHDGEAYKIVETRKGLGLNDSNYSANVAVAMAKQETVLTITNNLEGKLGDLRSNLDSMTGDVEETVSNLADDRNFLEKTRDYIMGVVSKGKKQVQKYKQ